MTYTLKDEISIIILLIVYGIYISLYYEILNILVMKLKNKIIKIFTEIILCLLQIYISYLFIYKIQDGYIPIYFLGFILTGVLIYFLYHSRLYRVINYIFEKVMDFLKKVIKEIIEFLYPKYLKEIKSTLIKRRKLKKIKDIEIWEG